MPVVDSLVERLSFGCVLFLTQVRIGAVVEQQLDDVHAADGGGVRQRRAGAEVIALVFAHFVRQRGILQQQFTNPRDVARVTGGRQIDDRSAAW